MVKPAVVPSVPRAAADPTLLLTAAVSRLAATIGVRLIVIKGIAADQYGLRPAHISSDVDVIVSHDDYGLLVDELGKRGWRRRPHDPDTDTFPVHSASMYHPEWAADIDVHFRYPGLEVEDDIFGLLWAQRTTMWCGNQPICIPGLVDAIMIGAVTRSGRASRGGTATNSTSWSGAAPRWMSRSCSNGPTNWARSPPLDRSWSG